jgi:Flp pilus assembly protein CpaB
MKRKGIIAIVLATGLSALVPWTAYSQRFEAAQPAVDLVVAASDLKADTQLDQSLLTTQLYPRSSVPAGAFTEPASVIGEYTIVDIAKGEPILAKELSDPEQTQP